MEALLVVALEAEALAGALVVGGHSGREGRLMDPGGVKMHGVSGVWYQSQYGLTFPGG